MAADPGSIEPLKRANDLQGHLARFSTVETARAFGVELHDVRDEVLELRRAWRSPHRVCLGIPIGDEVLPLTIDTSLPGSTGIPETL